MDDLVQITLDGGIPASESSPPPFGWEEWYAGIGGRKINITEVNHYLKLIHGEQITRFGGPVAKARTIFASSDEASAHVKAKALEFGADIVGICEIEPSDLYRGRTITERYAIAVGARMRYREFQTVPSRESAIECMRVYHSLGEVVIKLAEHIRAIGYSCEIEHPLGDSNLLHIPIGLKAGF